MKKFEIFSRFWKKHKNLQKFRKFQLKILLGFFEVFWKFWKFRKILCFFGEKIGLIFQIIDDILDVTSSQTKHGNKISSDFLNDKSTYVTLLGIERSRRYVQEAYHQAIHALSQLNCNFELLRQLAEIVHQILRYLIINFTDGVVARHGLILWQNEATGSRKVFKYLPGLRDTILSPKIATKVQKSKKSRNSRIFILFNPSLAGQFWSAGLPTPDRRNKPLWLSARRHVNVQRMGRAQAKAVGATGQ